MSTALEYRQWDAPAAISSAVRCIWSLRGHADGSTQPIVSDGCVEIVLNLADAFEQVTDTGAAAQPLAMVVGPTALPTVVRPSGVIDVLGIRLQPWAAARALGVGMQKLRDRNVPLADVLRGPMRHLPEQVVGARTDAERLAAVVGTLMAALPRETSGVARRAVERVTASGEVPSVQRLADTLGRSTRTVQRVFADDVGLSPKTLLRIVRIQRALGLALSSPALRWSAIAARAGYHDQSHFGRDFRGLVGCTPTQFRPDDATLTASFVEEAAGA